MQLGGILINNSTDIPTPAEDIVHKLFFRTTGSAYHIQVLLGTEQDLATIMATIGWWLKSTEQGMWSILQMAEESLCMCWLLFSAEEYKEKH